MTWHLWYSMICLPYVSFIAMSPKLQEINKCWWGNLFLLCSYKLQTIDQNLLRLATFLVWYLNAISLSTSSHSGLCIFRMRCRHGDFSGANHMFDCLHFYHIYDHTRGSKNLFPVTLLPLALLTFELRKLV